MSFKKALLTALFLLAFIPQAQAVIYSRATTTQSVQEFVPTTGQTITIARSNDSFGLINPATDLAALTVTMPASPKDGDKVTLMARKNITSLSFTGGTVDNPLLAIASSYSVTYIYDNSLATWVQYGGDPRNSPINLTTICSTSFTRGLCAAAYGYADPRWYGASCSTSFNQSGPDDAPYIQAALNDGYSVKISRPGCRAATRFQAKNDRQRVWADDSGGAYNHNYMGSGAYIFVPNDLALNRSTTLNCVFDTNGYDNVSLDVPVRGNYALAGSVAMCNSVGIRSGRAAAFLNISNGMVGNMGAAIGAAMTSIYDYRGTSTDSVEHGTGTKSFTTDTGRFWTAGMYIVATATGITPTTTMTGTVTSYNSGTGALVLDITSVAGTAGTYDAWSFDTPNNCVPVSTGSQAGLRNNVFQFRANGLDMIGNCMGAYGNFTDFHANDVYCAAAAHNCMAGLPGYGLTGSVSNFRFEFSGIGAGPTSDKTYYNKGTTIYYSTNGYLNLANGSFDRNRSSSIWAREEVVGRRPRNISLTNIASLGAFYGGVAGLHSTHFLFEGVDGISASGVSTYSNGTFADYVVTFDSTNTYVNWNGTGGAQGAGAATGQWNTSYFNFITTPTNFSYNVPGVGIKLDGLVNYTETEYNIGNSSTAFTISLVNGTLQKVTATGNATVTMPAAVSGKSFTLRYLTGAGGFTAAFTGVKWPGGTAPTLTAGAGTMDIFNFISDGTSWFGTTVQNYTP